MLKEMFMLALSMAPKQSWPTYDEKELDRTEFLTSSEVTGCLRRSFFSKFPDRYPLPVGAGGTNGYMDRGHAVEAWLVKTLQPLKPLGYGLEYMGEEQRSFYDPDSGVSGTPDGVITTPTSEVYLAEVKSIDPRTNKSKLPRHKHVMQCQQNMYLVNKCLGLGVKQALLFYIDASNVHDVQEFVIDYSQEMVDECLSRAEALWTATEPDALEPEGVYTGDCDFCPFTHHCSQVVKANNEIAKMQDIPTPFLAGETPELDEVQGLYLEQWLDAKEGIREYTDQLEQVEDEVRKLVIANRGYIEFGGKKIVGRMQPGRSSVDMKALAEVLDPTPFMKQGAPFTVISIKK